MEPFSTKLLTILVLICISWVGITCVAVLIVLIVFICFKCVKHHRSKSIKPIRTSSTISMDDHSPTISPIPITNTNQQKKSEKNIHRNNTNSVMDEHSYSNNKNKYKQQEYTIDEANETTTTINESPMYGERHKKRQYQPVKPITDVGIIDRQTPYPPDVLAREKLMNYNRFSADNKY